MAEFHDLKSEVQSWNLYTDEKLVSKLDGFLNHMMAQCEIINKNTEQTLYETNAVSIYLSDTFNALSNLSNKKFIENSMAPLEEPQIVPKEIKQFQEVTVEKKQENFQKALKNVIDAFNITANDEDEMTLSKSNTLSMATMFKTGDHLPFIIGSKAFNQDEFIGIVDRTDDIDKYLRGLNKDALGDDNSPTAMNGQYAGGSSSNQNNSNNPRSSSMMIHAQPVSNLPPIPGATNRVAINNTTLGPPPPLQQLLQQYEERGAGGAGPAGGRGGLLGEIQQRGQDRPANPMGRGNLLGEIAAAGQDRPANPMGGRGNLLGEIAAAGQERSERQPTMPGGRGNLLGEIAAAGGRSERQPTMPGGRGNLLGEIAAAGQERSERPPNPMGGRGGLLAEIAQKGQDREGQPQRSFQQTLNDQLGGGAPGQPRPAQQYGMQDEGPAARRVSDIKSNPLYQPLQPQQTKQNRLFDEDEDDEIGNRDMFRSSNAKKKNFDNLLNPMAGGGNPMLSSMAMSNANPFDPFGLSNPFMPFNPKSANAQAAVQRDEQKKQPQPERDSLASMANTSVYEDKSRAYEDEKKEEKKGNRLTKLFEDSDEDEESRFTKQRLLSQKYRGDIQPRFEDKAPEPVVQQKQTPAPNARVSKLFDDDEEGDFLSKKVTQPKKETPKPKLIEQDEDDSPLRSPPKKKEDPVRQSKPAKPSLFDDDDDDGGLGLRLSKKPEPAKKKKGVFDDDDDDILEEKKETLKPKPAQKSLTTKKSLFDNDDEEDQPSPPKKIAPPVIREEPKPVVRQEPKPVYEEPKPVVREEPKPVIFEQPKPVVREEPKVEPVQPRPDFRPLAQEVLEIKEEKSLQDSWAAPKTAGTQNLTQMIKAAALAKKKKNSSDESDSDDSDDSPPVRKPVTTVTPVQPVVEQEPPRVVEEPKVQTWQQEKPVTRQEDPELYSPITNTRGSGHLAEPIVEKVEPPREEKHEEERHSVTKQPSGVSSRISDLQNKLNLNMMALKPGEGIPEHMRKAKLSVMREEDSPQTDQSYAESRTQSEAVNENPGGISHMAALEKPAAMQGRAKKTIMFEDDDEDEPKEIKKPAVSYNPPPAKVETPVYEEPQYTQPAYTQPTYAQPTYTQPAYTQPAARNDSFEEAPATRASTKKKVAWGDDDDNAGGADPLGFSPKKTQAPTTSSANDPMALLRGIPGVGETKSISKKSSGKDMFRDDDDEDLGLTRKSNTKPAAPAMPTMSLSDPNNPMALLSGLKKMDEGRKSTKGKSKGKSKLFDDDDDDGPPVLRPSTKVEEPRPSTKARPSEKSKLFNDSDEDGDFLKKKPASITKPQQKAGPKKTLFDDSD